MSEIRENEPTTYLKLEIDLDDESDWRKFESMLSPALSNEALEQLVYCIRTLMTRYDKFINHCGQATEALGNELNTKYGGEESFFGLAPDSKLVEARSTKPLQKIGYSGDYHSVAIIQIPAPQKNSLKTSIVLDLTYYNVNRQSNKTIAVFKIQNEESSALEDYYGGKWRITYQYSPQVGKWIFLPK